MAEERGRTSEDALMTRIGQVIMLSHAGDREEARHRFGDLWAEIGDSGEPLHRCTLAHYMADTQDDPVEELAWDLRALSAADELADGRPADEVADGRPAGPGDTLAVRSLYPSLHLNLAADYVKLRHFAAARGHLRRARGAMDVLADDGYGRGIRAAVERLEATLEESARTGRAGPLGPPRSEN